MAQRIPDEVRRFLLTSVPSVPFLEALLLLRAQPDQQWDAAAVARRLYVTTAVAGELLQQLVQAGIGQPAGEGTTCTWGPPAPLAALIDELARHYAENLVGVTQLIHSRTDQRARQFADAFRWRKEH